MIRMVALIGGVLALSLLPSNLVASYQVGYAVAVLLVLPLTDRIRTGLIIAVGSALSALGFVPFGLLAHDIWSASALRIIAGAGLAAVYLPGVRVVAAAAALSGVEPQAVGLLETNPRPSVVHWWGIASAATSWFAPRPAVDCRSTWVRTGTYARTSRALDAQ